MSTKFAKININRHKLTHISKIRHIAAEVDSRFHPISVEVADGGGTYMFSAASPTCASSPISAVYPASVGSEQPVLDLAANTASLQAVMSQCSMCSANAVYLPHRVSLSPSQSSVSAASVGRASPNLST